jgi:hypothetical protein
MPTFSDGRDTSITSDNRERRLYNQDRFKGCIHGGSDTSNISKVFNLPTSGAAQKERDSSNLLPRRYLYPEQDGGSLDFTWIYHQLSKELLCSFPDSRIPRLYIQYNQDEDQNTKSQVSKGDSTSQTIAQPNQILSVGSKSIRENHGNDSSSRGNVSAYSISTEGSGKEFTEPSSEVGSSLSTDGIEQKGASMVDQQLSDDERSSDSSANTPST